MNAAKVVIQEVNLAALGAKDGFMLSGEAIDDDDPLSRRDEGFEFLDVTSQVAIRATTRLTALALS